MNKLISVIVDDEMDARSTLRCHLEKYCPEVTVAAEAASVEEAVAAIRQHRPDLVFLDIDMPFQNGFALFGHFPQPDFDTIFVTAYDSYALQAIRHHALDYILKPINIQELKAAVGFALQRRSARPDPEAGADRRARLGLLAGELNAPPAKHDKVPLAVLDGFLFVRSEDIIHCRANGNYTEFYFTNRPQLLTSRALGYYETMLKPYGFIRVHHKHLINPAHVERYRRGAGGSTATMSDQSEIVISQRRKEEFMEIMDKYGML